VNKTMRGIIPYYRQPLAIYESFILYRKVDNLSLDPNVIMTIPVLLTEGKMNSGLLGLLGSLGQSERSRDPAGGGIGSQE